LLGPAAAPGACNSLYLDFGGDAVQLLMDDLDN
jgi:hypothetical protein